MRLVQHPNVVRLFEVIDTPTTLYLVMELAEGGDLFDYIIRHEGGVAEDTAKRHFAQIVRAVAYCHQLHVVHRDLKPENVVFFPQQGAVKLTDFGFSNLFQPGRMLATSCGSLAYSAPEILLGEEYDAPAVGEKPTKTLLLPKKSTNASSEPLANSQQLFVCGEMSDLLLLSLLLNMRLGRPFFYFIFFGLPLCFFVLKKRKT